MNRFFEKISYKQFCNDTSLDKDVYDNYILPKRCSKYSAGYDFFAIHDMIIKPGEILKIPTGYKAIMNNDEFLMIVVRSSMGFKYNVRMCNQVGIIDSDYYNNCDNEGHIWISLQNEGDKDYIIKKDTSYAQGIFLKYLTCNDSVNDKRIGGIGSSDRKSDVNEK